jgi:hypothetical protein
LGATFQRLFDVGRCTQSSAKIYRQRSSCLNRLNDLEVTRGASTGTIQVNDMQSREPRLRESLRYDNGIFANNLLFIKAALS